MDGIIVPDALAAWPMSPTRAGLAMSCLSHSHSHSQDRLEDGLEDGLEDLLSSGGRSIRNLPSESTNGSFSYTQRFL
jgi:hypothetical protein